MIEKKSEFEKMIEQSFVQNVFSVLDKRKKGGSTSKLLINQKGFVKQLNTDRLECYTDFRPISKIL